jgi:hypothetical protein
MAAEELETNKGEAILIMPIKWHVQEQDKDCG